MGKDNVKSGNSNSLSVRIVSAAIVAALAIAAAVGVWYFGDAGTKSETVARTDTESVMEGDVWSADGTETAESGIISEHEYVTPDGTLLTGNFENTGSYLWAAMYDCMIPISYSEFEETVQGMLEDGELDWLYYDLLKKYLFVNPAFFDTNSAMYRDSIHLGMSQEEVEETCHDAADITAEELLWVMMVRRTHYIFNLAPGEDECSEIQFEVAAEDALANWRVERLLYQFIQKDGDLVSDEDAAAFLAEEWKVQAYYLYSGTKLATTDGPTGQEANSPVPYEKGRTDYAAEALSSTQYNIYSSLKTQICEVATGKRTSTKFSVPVSGLSWSYSSLGLSSDAGESAVAAALDKVLGNLISLICDWLSADLPFDMYWWAGACDSNWSYYYDGSRASVTSLTINMEVSPAYAAETYEVDLEQVQRAMQAAERAWAIVEQYADLSDCDKLWAYWRAICKLTDYNYIAANQAESGTTMKDVTAGSTEPWNIIWVFNGEGNVVCEGYAKAFQYLCNLSTFESPNTSCRYVTGYHVYAGSELELNMCYDDESTGMDQVLEDAERLAAEKISDQVNGGELSGHAWNVVTLDNGHYLVDSASEEDSHFLELPTIGNMDDGYVVSYISRYYGYYNCDTDEWVDGYYDVDNGEWVDGGFEITVSVNAYVYADWCRMGYSEDEISLYSIITPTIVGIASTAGTAGKLYDGTTEENDGDLSIALEYDITKTYYRNSYNWYGTELQDIMNCLERLGYDIGFNHKVDRDGYYYDDEFYYYWYNLEYVQRQMEERGDAWLTAKADFSYASVDEGDVVEVTADNITIDGGILLEYGYIDPDLFRLSTDTITTTGSIAL